MMKKGQHYKCSDCGCEIEVTKGPKADAGGNQDPTCCCGESMEMKSGAAVGR